MNQRFTRVVPDDELKVSQINDLQEAIERMDSTGWGDCGGVTTGTMSAKGSCNDRSWILARMLTEFVDIDAWMNANPGASVPQLFNAIEQTFDDQVQDWVDVPGGELNVDFPYKQALDQNQQVVCVMVDNRWIAIPHSPVRLAITAKTPPMAGTGTDSAGYPLGSGDTSGDPWYPDQADDPTVYPITFVTVPAPAFPARWEVTPTDEDPDPNKGTFVSPMSVPIGPHATVMNLDQRPGNYLPEGTPVSCFSVGKRWFTKTAGPYTGLFAARLLAVEDPSTFEASVTSGSASITGIVDTTFYPIGTFISGLGIPAGTSVLALTSETTLLLTANATASSMAALLTATDVPKRYEFIEQMTSGGGIYTQLPFGRTGLRALALNDPVIDVSSQPLVWMRPFLEADIAPFTVTATSTAASTSLLSVMFA